MKYYNVTASKLSFIMFTFNLHIFGLHLIEPTLRFDSLIFHLLCRLIIAVLSGGGEKCKGVEIM